MTPRWVGTVLVVVIALMFASAWGAAAMAAVRHEGLVLGNTLALVAGWLRL